LTRNDRRLCEILVMILAMTTIQTISWAGAGLPGAAMPQAKAASQPLPGEKLVKEGDCTSCHAVDHKVVGPAFMDVAKRYAGQPGAVGKLSQKIRAGGSGIWGAVPMTPHPDFTDAQLKQIVTWVLSTRGTTAPKVGAKPMGKEYSYTLADGKAAKLNFPLFEQGQSGNVTKDVFKGYEQYNSYCYRCHGQDVTGSEIAPDLRHTLSVGMTQQQFLATAMAGRPDKGMPSWAGFFSEQEITQIYQYVKARSLELVPIGRPESSTD
jgi:cytochrome c